MSRQRRSLWAALLVAGGTASLVLTGTPRVSGDESARPAVPGRPGAAEPSLPTKTASNRVGSAVAGRDVFRFETFGNEGFWTDAMRMPKGMEDAKVTPLDALKVGLLVDADAIPAGLKDALAKELKTDLSAANAPLMNDPMTTVKLIEANAVVGMVAKDSNGDGRINIAAGDKVGVSCAICHTISDKSVFDLPGGGSVGKRIDGPAALVLDMGKLLATAANSRAYYPNLQLEIGGKTIGRAPKGLTPDSTEAEVDAYLTNRAFYPVGTFDETQDGVGNPVVNQPLFRQDLAAPYATAGEFAVLDDISNGSYTTNLDPTTLLAPAGREFLRIRAGAAGDELATGYAKVLAATGVRGHPFVKATVGHQPGMPQHPVGRRVDDQKLIDMNAYLHSLPDPRGAKVDPAAFARGRETFAASNCTACHNVDQGKPVSPALVEMKTIFPGYAPMVMAQRTPPLTPVQNAPGGFDDKMIVVDASDRGDIRGNAIPMLLDLARKPMFLHDASVPSLDALLDPARGEAAPHPFYVKDAAGRADVVAFLKGVDTAGGPGGKPRAAGSAGRQN